jgi:hypothetical protein
MIAARLCRRINIASAECKADYLKIHLSPTGRENTNFDKVARRPLILQVSITATNFQTRGSKLDLTYKKGLCFE